jgi:hypothetical protein
MDWATFPQTQLVTLPSSFESYEKFSANVESKKKLVKKVKKLLLLSPASDLTFV